MVGDARSQLAWEPAIKRVEMHAGHTPVLSARYLTSSSVGRAEFAFQEEIVEWQPPHRLVCQGASPRAAFGDLEGRAGARRVSRHQRPRPAVMRARPSHSNGCPDAISRVASRGALGCFSLLRCGAAAIELLHQIAPHLLVLGLADLPAGIALFHDLQGGFPRCRLLLIR